MFLVPLNEDWPYFGCQQLGHLRCCGCHLKSSYCCHKKVQSSSLRWFPVAQCTYLSNIALGFLNLWTTGHDSLLRSKCVHKHAVFSTVQGKATEFVKQLFGCRQEEVVSAVLLKESSVCEIHLVCQSSHTRHVSGSVQGQILYCLFTSVSASECCCMWQP